MNDLFNEDPFFDDELLGANNPLESSNGINEGIFVPERENVFFNDSQRRFQLIGDIEMDTLVPEIQTVGE